MADAPDGPTWDGLVAGIDRALSGDRANVDELKAILAS